MKGTFTFRQDGIIVAEQDNVITDAGRSVILRYMAGQVGKIVQSISVGIGNKPGATTDKSLQFEFDRNTIELTSIDMQGGRIVYKTTLSENTVGVIGEAGTWTMQDSGQDFSSRMLFSFDSQNEPWQIGSNGQSNPGIVVFQPEEALIGVDCLRMNAAPSGGIAVASLLDFRSDLSGYSNNDVFTLAFKNYNGATQSLKIRLKSSNADYFEYTANTPSVGYNFLTFNKSNFGTINNPSWNEITSADVILTTASSSQFASQVTIDGLRIDDGDIVNQDYVLVSRTRLDPVVKTNKSPMEIEYAVNVLG